MATLLIVNPNTSADVSALLLRHAQASAPAGVQVVMATAAFGARYISGELAAAVAGHAALDAYAQHVAQQGAPGAVLLGCFGDPGLFALRALAAVPVLGLAEAAMQRAAQRGRFAIVTGGAAWGPMLQRLAQALGLADALAGVHTVPQSGAELAANPTGAVRLLRAAVLQAQQRWPDAQAVLLGGAGLAGMATPVAQGLTLPVLDSVAVALEAAWPLLGANNAAPPTAEPGPWQGLSAPLLHLLSRSSS
jgi:allantoin racemase